MRIRLACIAVAMFEIISGTAHSQVNVTTYHADNFRSGQYTQETILTPANVNSTQFGRLFTTNLDGRVYAQPLYLSNVTIAGGTHNVLYVATEHDSVYAIDADSGSIYWKISLIPAGGSTVNSSSDLGCSDLVPEVGITGTPVIDTSTGTLYVVAKSKVAGSFVQYLHAIDVVAATEKFGGPTLIQATVNGTASDGVGGVVSFNPLRENQRAALLLENGHVIIGWSSHCDTSPWHGWVMTYSASTLAQEGVFNSSPNGYANGVWMSANGPAADSAGNLYFATGNGSWNGTTDYGDSIVKVGPPSGGSFPLVDYFTPYNQATLSGEDLDLASGGPVLLPPLANGKQLLALQAKTGTIYLVNAGNMGKYCPNQSPPCTNSDTQIVQELVGASVGVWGSPAYWNGSVYWGPSNDNTLAADYIRAYSFNAGGSGLLSTTPTSKSANEFGFSSPIPVISANGSGSGILWAVDNEKYQDACTGTVNCQALYAYDATNLNSMLYNSYQAAGYRDVPGGAVKFATPIVANGKVYFGSQTSVSAFGLLAAGAPPSPTFSPAGGAYTATQTVALSDTTSGATIYYTTNGTTPTTSSAMYSVPLTVSTTTTIEAIAVAGGSAASPVAVATYTISAAGSPVGVPFAASANIDAIGTDGTATLNGGLDGSGNSYSGTLLGTSVTWSGVSFTLNASGTADGVSNKALTAPAGSYQTMYLLGTGVNGNQPNQSFVVTYTDGTTSTYTQSLSDWYTPQSYPGEAIAVAMPYRLTSTGAQDSRPFYLYGYTFALNGSKTVASVTLPASRNVVVLAIELLSAGATTAVPTFSPAAGTYSTAQTVTLSDATSGATIYYTTNGTTPTTASTVYSAPLTVSATTTIKALATASGAASSAVASATYTISVAPPSPTFSPAGGTSGGTQTVTLSDTASGATIYYTTNGTTPTTTSAAYSAALTVSMTTTIKAIAVAAGSASSPVASATYAISAAGSPVGVSFTASANIDAIGTDGTATLNGGLDGGGSAYSGTLLGGLGDLVRGVVHVEHERCRGCDQQQNDHASGGQLPDDVPARHRSEWQSGQSELRCHLYRWYDGDVHAEPERLAHAAKLSRRSHCGDDGLSTDPGWCPGQPPILPVRLRLCAKWGQDRGERDVADKPQRGRTGDRTGAGRPDHGDPDL